MKVNCHVFHAPTRRSKCKGRNGHELCGVNDRKPTVKPFGFRPVPIRGSLFKHGFVTAGNGYGII